MRTFSRLLSVLLFLTLCFSCKHNTPEQEVGNMTKEFVDALYNLNYEKAQTYCTPQSSAIISFLASNISEEHLSMVKKAGKAQVDILKVDINEDETAATVLCKITNYLKLSLLDNQSCIDKEIEKEIDLIKDKGKWVVDLHM